MGLFQKLGRMIGIGKTSKRFPKQEPKQENVKDTFKPARKIQNKNRASHVIWGACSLKLAKPYR